MNKSLKINYLIILLSLAVFVNSCDTSNTSNIKLSDEEYFAQQASKSNQNDTLLLGLSIGMNKEHVLAQLEKEGAWRFYSTLTGKDRLLLRGLDANEELPVDSYGMDEAFFAKVILKSENGRYSEETITILLDFYENKLLGLKVCAFGSLHNYASDCDNEMFHTLRSVLAERYGNPYKERDHDVLWVDGSIHISLTFEGIKKFKSNAAYSYYYEPLYLITYSDWSFSKEVEKQKELKQQEELKQKREIDSLNQERLKEEYNKSEFKGL